MTRLVVDLVELESLVERLRAFQHQLGSLHDDVERAAHRAGVTWTGVAAAAEDARQGEWSVASVRAQEALASLSSVVTTARANYAAAIAANRAMWAQ